MDCCQQHVDGLIQDCSISIANALEILQSFTNPSTSFPEQMMIFHQQEPGECIQHIFVENSHNIIMKYLNILLKLQPRFPVTSESIVGTGSKKKEPGSDSDSDKVYSIEKDTGTISGLHYFHEWLWARWETSTKVISDRWHGSHPKRRSMHGSDGNRNATYC